MCSSANYGLWPHPRIGHKGHVPFYNLPYIQPFCSNKTLQYIFWKFPHKPSGSEDFISGTKYCKICYKAIFSCYFKTGHVQGTEAAIFTC